MTPLSNFDRLPNTVLVHVIGFENDRLVWARLCKKAHKCWQEAGVLIINKNLSHRSMQEYVIQAKITPWNKTFGGIDPFLRSLVKNLFPRQTLLPGRTEICDQLYSRDLRYRDAAHLNLLHTQITNASDQQLVAFARWLCEQSPSAREALKGLPDSKPPDVQADFVYTKLHAHANTIRVGRAAVNNVRNLQAVPEEILALNVQADVLEKCLYRSIARGQLPFVAALLRSPKRNQLVLNIDDLIFHSLYFGNIDAIQMLVPRWSHEHLDSLIDGLEDNFEKLSSAKRFKILKLYLEKQEGDQALHTALKIAATRGKISWKERLPLVNLVLSDPRVGAAALHNVLSLMSGGNTLFLRLHKNDQLPSHFHLKQLFRLFLQKQELRPDALQNALRRVLLEQKRTIQQRLELAEILLADPRLAREQFYWVLFSINLSDKLPPKDRLAIFQLFLNDPRFTFDDLMEELKKCCEKGWLEEARLLLADPRHTADTLEKAIGAFTDAARRGPCEEDCFAIARLLLAHPLFSPESRDYLLLRIISGYFEPGYFLIERLDLPQRQLRLELFRELVQQKRVSPIALYRAVFNVVRNVPYVDDYREMIRVILAEPETPSDALAGGVRAALSERYAVYEKVQVLLTAEGATPAMLSACLPELVSTKELTHPEYQEALSLIANHPNARHMPLIIRTWLVFERVVAFLKTPFRALGNWKFSNHTSIALTGTLFLPATLVQFVALQIWKRTNPSR